MAGSNGFLSILLLGLVIFVCYEVFITKEPMPFFEQFRSHQPTPVNTTPTPTTNETAAVNVTVNETPIVEGDYPLRVDFIDIGQGDSSLIKFPNGNYMLIDGGPRYMGTTLINYLQNNNISQIDTVVATHPDADHIGGLIKVFTVFGVKRYLYTNYSCTTLTCEELGKAVDRAVAYNNLTTITTSVGTSYFIDNSTRVTILNPPMSPLVDSNSNSIVIKLSYGDTSFLFTGDCDSACEQAMISTKRDLDSDVLKVAHHGSNSGTSQAFLDLVTPTISVISVGKDNAYGHPSTEVLKRLIDTRVLRTDELGTIVIKSNGEKLEVGSP